MKDVVFTDKLVKICDDLLLTGHKKNHKKIDKLYKELALLLEERFNIKYEIYTGLVLATLPPASSIGSAITDYNYKELVEASDYTDLMRFMENNNKVLDIDAGFYINYKNKTIEYKGKHKFTAHVYMEPIKLAQMGINGHEFAAALLHEIGHDFEFLRYAIYTTRKAEKLITNIREAIHKKSSLDKLIEITVKEVHEEQINIEDMDLEDKLKVLVKVPEKLFEFGSDVYSKRLNLGNTVVAGKEFEMLADDFVQYFNMEHFLPSGLNKMNIYFTTLGKSSIMTYSAFVKSLIDKEIFNGFDDFVKFIIAILVYLIFMNIIYPAIFNIVYPVLGDKTREFLGKVMSGLSNLYIGYNIIETLYYIRYASPLSLGLTVLSPVVTLIKDYSINYQEKESMTVFPYENDIDRYKAIKQNLINKIKNERDPEIKKIVLNKINMVDKEIKKAQQILTKYQLVSVIPGGSFALEHRDGNYLNPIYMLTSIIRTHMNNDLYISAAKLDLHNKE